MKKLAIAIIAGVAVAGGAAYYGVNNVATSKIKVEIDKKIAELKKTTDLQELSYDSLAVDAFTQSATISGITATGPVGTVLVDSLVINDFDFMNEIPRHSDMKLENVRVPLDTLKGFSSSDKKDFADFGITKELVFDVSTKQNYDLESKNMKSSTSVQIDNIGDLNVDFDLGSIDLVAMEELKKNSPDGNINPMVAMGLIGGIELNSVSIDFNDTGILTSFTEKLRKEEAPFKATKDASEARKTMASMLTQQLTMMKKQDDKTAKKIIQFVESGKGIKVAVNPTSKGIMALGMSLQPLAQKMDIEGLRKILGLEVTVK